MHMDVPTSQRALNLHVTLRYTTQGTPRLALPSSQPSGRRPSLSMCLEFAPHLHLNMACLPCAPHSQVADGLHMTEARARLSGLISCP